MSEVEKAEITRRKYLKYAGGAVIAVAAVVLYYYGRTHKLLLTVRESIP